MTLSASSVMLSSVFGTKVRGRLTKLAGGRSLACTTAAVLVKRVKIIMFGYHDEIEKNNQNENQIVVNIS